MATNKKRNPSQNTKLTSVQGSSTTEQLISTTNEPVSGSNLTKDKIQKNNLPKFNSIQVVADMQVPRSDEMVLRKLFKKFENQWSRFQKHSKLQQNYTIGRLKSIKQKIDSAEALWNDKELQKKIHKKYKVFCAKYEDKQGVFESRDEEIRKFALNFKELEKNAFKLYMIHRYPVDESSALYKQSKHVSEDIED